MNPFFKAVNLIMPVLAPLLMACSEKPASSYAGSTTRAATFGSMNVGGDSPGLGRIGLYDYAPSAILEEDGKTRVLHCGQTSGRGEDSIFFSRLSFSGTMEISSQNVLLPSRSDSAWDGSHLCAPSVLKHRFSGIFGGKNLYKLYFECAPNVYQCDAGGRNCSKHEAFTQICHAVSEDGISWKKYHSGIWQREGRFAESPEGATPVIQVAQRILENCRYQFRNGKHTAEFNGSSSCANLGENYGVGQPSAVVMPIGETGQIWLFYYDSRGSWGERGVYLAKSWDGFNFEPAVKTNLTNPVEVKFIPSLGLFVGAQGINSNAYIAVSRDGVTWQQSGYPPKQDYLIGTTDSARCTAPGKTTFVSDPHGMLNSLEVRIMLGEGFYGSADQGHLFPRCNRQDLEITRGASWDIYAMNRKLEYQEQGEPLLKVTASVGTPWPAAIPAPATLSEGPFAIGSEFYYSNGVGQYCRYFNSEDAQRSSGIWDLSSVRRLSGAPANMVSPPDCQLGKTDQVPQGLFRVGQKLYYSSGVAYCAFRSTEEFQKVMGNSRPMDLPNYLTVPTLQADHSFCRN